MKLPDQAWAVTSGGAAILAALDAPQGQTRLVGGAVRDALLGLPVTDVDLATALAPEEVVRRLETAGIGVAPTGIAHGTVTAITHDIKIEVTTLRHDISTDGRRATVAFTDDWRADAARRDFTINALYAALPSGEISDFFGGIDDLKAGRVRFIGDPLSRIAEDHLRILRFFRFHGRFGTGAPDQAAITACEARANDLMALSRERIRDELLRILALPKAVSTLGLMLERAILSPVLPEIDARRIPVLAALASREAEWGAAPDPLRRLAALLPAAPGQLADIGARLRLSKRQAARLTAMGKRYSAPPGDWRAAAYWDGTETSMDRLLLLGPEAAGSYAAIRDWRRPVVPISGKDIIATGVSAGPEVSRRLAQFEKAWVNAGFPTEPEAIQCLLAVVSPA